MQTSKGKGLILARIIGFIGAMLMLTIVVVAQTEAVASQSVATRAAPPVAKLHHAAPPKVNAPPKVYAPPELYAPTRHIAPAVRRITVAKAQMYLHHKVKAGETLSGIASKYRVPSWQPLAAVNPGEVKAPLYWVYTGHTIRIPTGHIAVRVYSAPKAHQMHKHYAPRKSYRARIVTGYSAGGSPQAIARQLLASYGWSSQWSCLNSLVSKESGWDTHAQNSSSRAYGIPQALPGSKMASEGSDWRDSARTQLSWMMKYLNQRYGGPCGAWAHSVANNWY